MYTCIHTYVDMWCNQPFIPQIYSPPSKVSTSQNSPMHSSSDTPSWPLFLPARIPLPPIRPPSPDIDSRYSGNGTERYMNGSKDTELLPHTPHWRADLSCPWNRSTIIDRLRCVHQGVPRWGGPVSMEGGGSFEALDFGLWTWKKMKRVKLHLLYNQEKQEIVSHKSQKNRKNWLDLIKKYYTGHKNFQPHGFAS